MESLNPIRRWKENDILFAANNFFLMAFVVSANKVGQLGWHPNGHDQICVEYIDEEAAKSWEKP